MSFGIHHTRAEDLTHVSTNRDTGRVSANGDSNGQKSASDAVLRHRSEFARFVCEESYVERREVLSQIYLAWEEWNRDYFEQKLAPPHFLLLEPKSPKALGDHSFMSGWGSVHQTRIRPSIWDGSHPEVRPGKEFAEGRLRLVLDIALHETLHQFQLELLGDAENSYKGHGPLFRDHCNRIGERLGLGPVRIAKARGRDRLLPSCAQWPLCVRPIDYYLGAYVGSGKKAATKAELGEAPPEPPKALADWMAANPEWAAASLLVAEELFVLFDQLFEMFPAPTIVCDQMITFLAKLYRHRRRTKPKQPAPQRALLALTHDKRAQLN